MKPVRPVMAVVAVLSVASFGGACASDSSGGHRATSTAASSAPSSADGGTDDPKPTTTSVPKRAVRASGLCEDAVLEEAGPITDAGLTEISGVVASREQPGMLWVHNDSGHPNEVWAIDHDGATRGGFTVTGARSVDWEDIGLGVGPSADGSYLYVGDIGDNSFTPGLGPGLEPRTDTSPAVIYRVPEPAAVPPMAEGSTAAVAEIATEPAVAFPVRYADGGRDAEALLADPVTGDVFVITKQWDREPAGLYRLPAEAVTAHRAPDGITTLERVADVAGPEGRRGPGLVTGADVSPDGTLVVLRTYGTVILWDRDPDDTLAETLAEPPACTRKLVEPQGEAVAIAADGRSLVTISEGDDVPLNWLRLPAG